jgi:hypothetical protein
MDGSVATETHRLSIHNTTQHDHQAHNNEKIHEEHETHFNHAFAVVVVVGVVVDR